MIFNLYALFALAISLSVLLIRSLMRTSLPPGPTGFPFMGNISLLWERKPWVKFTEWKDIYGDIVSVKFFGKTIVILNTHEAAYELLERRSKIYNGRPRSILINEIMTEGLAFPLVGYGELWKRHRRAARSALNSRAVELYHGFQEQKAQKLVQILLQDSRVWPHHVKDSLYNLFCSIGYGENSLSNDTTISCYLENFMTRIMQAAIPGSSLTDFFPSFASLPNRLSPWKRHYLLQFRQDSKHFEASLLALESDVPEQETMGKMILENRRVNEMTVKESAWLTAVLCGIGAEVTSSVLPVFFLAMALYPEVQHRAQVEIDDVVGRDRTPNFQDRNRLPYILAIVREVLRWRPIGPIGFPRCCLQDDYYQRYLIPAGSIVVPNIWAMNRNPHLYPDYDEFRPERYLGFKSDVPGAHGQGHVSFGFGDRLCSGIHIANDALFIYIAAILQTCDITKAAGSSDPTISNHAFEDFGIVTRPADFRCHISGRKTDP